MRKTRLLLLALLAAMAASPAFAQSGNLSAMPIAAWAKPLSDSEMSKLRGGFDGIAFSAFFTGTVDSLGNASGNLSSGITTGNTPPPSVTTSDGNVSISTVVGNFQGANGIFQIAQVPGSFNVVNNNLFIQVAIINVTNQSQLTGLTGLLGPVLH
jgi:hypothetical protein